MKTELNLALNKILHTIYKKQRYIVNNNPKAHTYLRLCLQFINSKVKGYKIMFSKCKTQHLKNPRFVYITVNID